MRAIAAVCQCLTFVAFAAIGCGDETSPPPRQPPSSSSTSSSSTSTSSTSGGGSGGESMGSGGSGGSMLGTVEIADVPDTPCSPLVGTVTSLYPDASGAPALSQVGMVGGKRYAGGRYVPGFVTFGLDGSAPSPKPVGIDPDFDLVTSEGATIGLASTDGVNVRYQKYAADDSPISGQSVIGISQGLGLAIAGDDAGGSLVVWGDSEVLNMRHLPSAGIPGSEFSFAWFLSTNAIVTSLARGASEFGLAWSTIENGVGHGRFTRLTPMGPVGPIVELTGDAPSHYVVKLAATPTGYALLLHAGASSFDVIVMILDADGKLKPPARRYMGLQFAYDLTAHGENLGLVAKRDDGSAAFRLLDGTGFPVESWKCLDAPSQDSYDQAGIDSDGPGWAIVYRTPGGGEKFVQTNLTGTAAP